MSSRKDETGSPAHFHSRQYERFELNLVSFCDIIKITRRRKTKLSIWNYLATDLVLVAPYSHLV